MHTKKVSAMISGSAVRRAVRRGSLLGSASSFHAPLPSRALTQRSQPRALYVTPQLMLQSLGSCKEESCVSQNRQAVVRCLCRARAGASSSQSRGPECAAAARQPHGGNHSGFGDQISHEQRRQARERTLRVAGTCVFSQ